MRAEKNHYLGKYEREKEAMKSLYSYTDDALIKEDLREPSQSQREKGKTDKTDKHIGVS